MTRRLQVRDISRTKREKYITEIVVVEVVTGGGQKRSENSRTDPGGVRAGLVEAGLNQF